MKTEKPIALINIASNLGAGRSAKGHSWFARAEATRDYLEARSFVVAGIFNIQEPHEPAMGNAKLRYADGILNVLRRLDKRVTDCLEKGWFPVCIGGDHSLAIGSVAASACVLKQKTGKRLGLVWVDAHIDMNTPETTPSGNIHGMALASILGLAPPPLQEFLEHAAPVQPQDSAVVGFRFADITEMPNIPAEGPAIVSMRELDQSSMAAVMEGLLPKVTMQTGGFHLSLDLDALDPSCAPGVNTPSPGGLTFREMRTICDMAAATGRLLSLDVVEHNPELGHDAIMLPVIGELISCALGAGAP